VNVDITVTPYAQGTDLIYVAERHAGAAKVLETYSTAGTVLAKP
jgi:hypothetical protein